MGLFDALRNKGILTGGDTRVERFFRNFRAYDGGPPSLADIYYDLLDQFPTAVKGERRPITALSAEALNKLGKPVIEVGGPTWGGIDSLPKVGLQVPYIVSNPIAEQGGVDIRATNSHLPFPDDSAGAIVGSCLHRFTYRDFAREAERVVVPGGFVAVQGALPRGLIPAFRKTDLTLVDSGYRAELLGSGGWGFGPDSYIFRKDK